MGSSFSRIGPWHLALARYVKSSSATPLSPRSQHAPCVYLEVVFLSPHFGRPTLVQPSATTASRDLVFMTDETHLHGPTPCHTATYATALKPEMWLSPSLFIIRPLSSSLLPFTTRTPPPPGRRWRLCPGERNTLVMLVLLYLISLAPLLLAWLGHPVSFL